MSFILKILVIFSLYHLASTLGDSYCNDLIPDSYKKFLAPSNEGKPVPVYVKLSIVDIDEINEENMDFRLHIYLHTAWNDTRLNKTSFATFNDECTKYFWVPDIYFERTKPAPGFTKFHYSFKVNKDGYFYITERLSLKVSCMMKFNNYPFDVQQCIFSVALMSTTDAIAEIKWFSDDTCPYMESPIEMLRKIEPLQFYFGKPTLHSITKEYFQGGSESQEEIEKDKFTYLLVNFTFVRRIVSSIITIYLPSALIVAMSWASFWMRLDSIPARVALSVTSLLTLCTQVQQYKRNLPPVSYVTAMDVWLFVCIFMVFATLVEFAICFNIYARSKDEEKKSSLNFCGPDIKLKKAAWAKITHLADEKINKKNLEEDLKGPCDPMKIDAYCKYIFPGLFILFAIIYWSYNLTVYTNYTTDIIYEDGEMED